MGLSSGWRDNYNDWGETFTKLFWAIATSFIYALCALGVRAVQFYSPIPGFEIAPILVTALGFYIASRIHANVTGGYVYHMHLVMTLVVGALVNFFDGMRSSKNKKDRYAHADRNWMQVDIYRVLISSVGMLVGFFLAPGVIWLFAGPYVVFIPHTPGPFPGFLPVGFEPWFAFGAEAIATCMLGFVLTFYGLTGYDPKSRSNSEYMSGLGTGALFVAAAIALTWNISGGCFDLALWVAEHLMVGILLGQTPFVAAPFDNIGEYWWVYVFANMLGWFVGIVLGFLAGGASVGMYDEMYDGLLEDEEEDATVMEDVDQMRDDSRIGSRSNFRSGGARNGRAARTEADVDKLAIAGGLFHAA